MGSFSNVAYNMSVEDKVLDYVIWMGNDYKALLKSYINQTGKNSYDSQVGSGTLDVKMFISNSR